MQTHDVFISYASKDKLTADKICSSLESNGIRCWITPRDVLPGSNWGESIIDAINDAKVMLLVFSSNSNVSNHIKREVERAVNRGRPVIPVRIEDVLPSKSLEYFISTQHWFDAYSLPLEIHLQRLAKIIKMFLSKLDEEYDTSHPEPGLSDRQESAIVTPIPPQASSPGKEEVVIPLKTERERPGPEVTGTKPLGKLKIVVGLLLASLAVGAVLVVGLFWGNSGKSPDPPVSVTSPAPAASVASPPPAAPPATPAPATQLSADDYVNQGVEAKDVGQKIAFFNKALEIKPDHVNALINRAATYFGKGENEQALADYNKAISLQPDNSEAYNAMGYIYLARRNYDQAIIDFNKAIDIDPKSVIYFTNRGNTYFYKKDYDMSLKDFTSAISLKPDFVTAYNNRGKVYAVQGNHEMAVNDFSKAISLDKNYGKAYKNRAAVYMEQGQDDLAISDFGKAISLKTDLAESYLCRGKIYKKKGEDKLASEDFIKAKALKQN